MKKLIIALSAVIFCFSAFSLNLEVYASEKNKKLDIRADTSSDKSDVLESYLLNEMNNNKDEVSTYQLPGDFTNLCKIVGTSKSDNVTYNNYEQKVLNFLVNGGLSLVPGYFSRSAIVTFVAGGASSVWGPKVPKSKAIYVTTQRRECKDSTGISTYLIISYYSDSKRTKHLYTQYKKS